MTLTKDDLQTMLRETEGRLGAKIESLESRIDKRLVEQTIAFERRLRDGAIKLAEEFRHHTRELRSGLVKVIKETFETVYADHPTKEEVDDRIEDMRDETDRRFQTHEERIEALEHKPTT